MTTTSEEYATCFGFTQEEVFTALEEFQLAGQKDAVKHGMMDLLLVHRGIFTIHGPLQII